MDNIDKKFFFVANNPVTGANYTEEDGLILLAKDNATPATLRFYREECERQGAKLGQLEAVDALIKRVDDYRVTHPMLCKVADVTLEEIAAMRAPSPDPAPTTTESVDDGETRPVDAQREGEPKPNPDPADGEGNPEPEAV